MPAKTPAPLTTPKVRWARDYVSVDFGFNRGLSASFGGEKARGLVPRVVFDAWVELLNEVHPMGKPFVTQGLTAFGRAALDLSKSQPDRQARVAHFATYTVPVLWPEWNAAPAGLGRYTQGSAVKMKFGARKPIEDGTVESVRGSMVICRFPMGLVRIPLDLLDQYNAGA
jgi:hypothetical protein